MNSLIPSTSIVNIPFIDVLEMATFDEAVAAAAAHFEQAVQENKPVLPWVDLVNVYRQVFATAHRLDLSRFDVPAAPQIPATDFLAAWVEEMEAEFGDMEAAAFANRSGVPMF